MSDNHPFFELTQLINSYSENKDSFDIDKLQSMREDISLCLFKLSDSASRALSEVDLADFERKRNYAERFNVHKNEVDESGKTNTVALAENLARIDNKKFEENYCESARKKERVRIILNSTNQILNAISSRLSMIK